jgi:hypothetical protein
MEAYELILMSVSPFLNVCRQRLDKFFPAATNTHATRELLDAVFSMQSVSYQAINM